MPQINFDDVPDTNIPGDTVPDGTYPSTIVGIEPGMTNKGAKWDVWSEIAAGPEKGKRIKDMWLWYDKGLSRTKACISGCGLTQKGNADYRPEHFIGCPVWLDVQTSSREVGDKTYTECKPRYAGYHRDEERPWTPKAKPAAPAPGKPEDDSRTPF